MKVRTGFVSNSSTTSFECDICGYSETYHDSISCSDFDVIYCEFGHCLCVHHIEEYFPDVGDNYENEDGELSVEYCPFCQNILFTNKDLGLYLLKEHGVPKEEVFAYIKSINKRRRVLRDEEYVEYVLKKIGKTSEDIELDINVKFKTFADFWEYITSKNEDDE